VETSEIIQNYESKIQLFENEIKELKLNLEFAHKRCEQFSQAYDALTHQLRELIRHRFGKKSERFIDPQNPQQDLFATVSETFTQAEAAGNTLEDITVPGQKRIAQTYRDYSAERRRKNMCVWHLQKYHSL
jgi:hypothetical protein